ncbi:MAG TPA: TetR/AcrR family transcriptional regulator [Thermomicrobiales bacterium]|nr:TetR/AcrR family transcriptional regulator [Thermomicrobiales bacterium]
MIDDLTATSTLRSRTRNAILEAAISVFVNDRSTSLGKVAERAGVARSTLHRYFPERSDLLNAVREYARDKVERIRDAARIHEGPASEAVVRLAVGYLEVWDAVMWDYMEAEAAGENPDESEDVAITQLIERGYKDGTIDPAIPNAWIQHTMYAMVYSAWDYIRAGHSRHEAAKLCEASIRKLITPPSHVTPPTTRSSDHPFG